MATNINPYLHFRGQAREAMTFYADLLGGELTSSTLGEFGMGGEDADKLMHAQITVDGRAVLMGADTPSFMAQPEGTSVDVSLFGGPEDAEAMREQWNRLAEGATIQQPLEKAPWGDEYGSLVDRFGVTWMLNIGGGGDGQ
ncbi:MAG TPA: hypothetical protein DHV14_00235 [Micrococcales bacterium]|uniref:VOC family protein n=1 Tax=Miniimonas arenae TaxID=676201 RepID=A0A5C5BED1_9MICO|nr:VOC family protein [Miniimonas arenae]TNU76540.1 VOC family protein [Miniimonas arenae]HCX83579.1 hypothetical protein [Micrococcales bacterium]